MSDERSSGDIVSELVNAMAERLPEEERQGFHDLLAAWMVYLQGMPEDTWQQLGENDFFTVPQPEKMIDIMSGYEKVRRPKPIAPLGQFDQREE